MKNRRYLFRMIIPCFPEINIFNRVARKTTALGPVMVATGANKLVDWDVEIIDENNYRGPLDNNSLVNHEVLQNEYPADVVGFYCGLSCTMPRVWELAKYYKHCGVTTVAGGWHVFYNSEESLNKNIDIVVKGDGDVIIREILSAIQKKEEIKAIIESVEVELESLPFPDFSLLKFAKMRVYPIGRIRGCSMHCEFCSVKMRARWGSSHYLFSVVDRLVSTSRAKEFFIVDDRIEEDKRGTIEFFNLIQEKFGNKLDFTVQVRLEAAKDREFLAVMKNAGVRRVCIGYESPINEDLQIMKKGIRAEAMINLTKIYRDFGFFVHGMFIWGYPLKGVKTSLTATERMRLFKKFIRAAKLDSIQILRPVPLIGTALRQRLEKEEKLLPLDLVGWEKYDGNYLCFIPDNMTLAELQECPTNIMSSFYTWFGWITVPLRTLIMPIDYIIRGWHKWFRGWWNDVIKVGARIMIGRWKRKTSQAKLLMTLQKSLQKNGST